MSRPVCSLLLLLTASAAAADPAPIALGDAVSGNIEGAAQVDAYRFTAAAGQRVFVERTASSNSSKLNWSLTDAYGRILAQDLTALGHLGPLALMGGSYTLSVTSEGGGLGSYAFALRAPVVTPSAVAVGSTLTDAIAGPGDVRRYTLAGVPGHKLYVQVVKTSNSAGLIWSLQDAAGETIKAAVGSLASAGPFDLTASDVTLQVSGETNAVGTYELALLDVADVALPMAIDADLASAVALPGQVARHAVTLPSARRVYLDVVATSNLTALNLALEDATGRLVVRWTASLADAGLVALAAGDYAVRVRGEAAATGTYTLRMHTVVDTVAAVALGDTVSGTVAVPGAKASYTVVAAAGKTLFLDVVSTSNPTGLAFDLVDGEGRAVVAKTTSLVDTGPVRLMGGTYTMTVSGDAGAETARRARMS